MNSFWILWFSGLLLTSMIMFFSWLWAKKIQNYSLVDAVWAFCFLLHVLLFSALTSGWWVRKLLLLGMVGLWSLRLGIFLTRRIYSHHPQEDSRYTDLRKSYAPNEAGGFFRFFQFQAFSVSLLTVPFLLSALNQETEISAFEIAGAALWFLAFLGEATADAQMARFKRDPQSAGLVCDVGLWRYSRHPNYFFENCIWWGYFLFACASPWGFLSIYCPCTILFLLLKVTGVPPAEENAVKFFGDKYRKYQKTTSVFVPWFKKDIV